MSETESDDLFTCEMCEDETVNKSQRHIDADGFALCPRCASIEGLIDPLGWECDACKEVFEHDIKSFPSGSEIFCLDCAVQQGIYNPVWECVACLDDYNEQEDNTPYVLKTSKYCSDCIKRLFDSAWQNERSYGNTKIEDTWFRPSDFPELFSEAYCESFEKLAVEYQTPMDQRVYCERTCQIFLGRRHRMINGQWATKECGKCAKVWCMHCGRRPSKESGVSAGSHQRHDSCGVKQQEALVLEAEALGNEVVLKSCPNCGSKYTRPDGCNHIGCTNCQTDFCYLCGQVTTKNDKHWYVVKGFDKKLSGGTTLISTRGRRASQCPQYNDTHETED